MRWCAIAAWDQCLLLYTLLCLHVFHFHWMGCHCIAVAYGGRKWSHQRARTETIAAPVGGLCLRVFLRAQLLSAAAAKRSADRLGRRLCAVTAEVQRLLLCRLPGVHGVHNQWVR